MNSFKKTNVLEREHNCIFFSILKITQCKNVAFLTLHNLNTTAIWEAMLGFNM